MANGSLHRPEPGARAGRSLLKAVVSGPGLLPLQGCCLHTGTELSPFHATFGLRAVVDRSDAQRPLCVHGGWCSPYLPLFCYLKMSPKLLPREAEPGRSPGFEIQARNSDSLASWTDAIVADLRKPSGEVLGRSGSRHPPTPHPHPQHSDFSPELTQPIASHILGGDFVLLGRLSF